MTDEDDVQALLDYVVGNNDGENLDLAAGEMDGVDGISSYDAQLLLESFKKADEGILLVPAGCSAEVNVMIKVTDEWLTVRENGGYIEGFTYISCISKFHDLYNAFKIFICTEIN